jgi:transposase
MPVKTDRNDARSIAQVMRIGWFSIVHVKSTGSQELRMLLANRKMLLTKQIDIENEIRGPLLVRVSEEHPDVGKIRSCPG